jgi:hypothetical protein
MAQGTGWQGWRNESPERRRWFVVALLCFLTWIPVGIAWERNPDPTVALNWLLMIPAAVLFFGACWKAGIFD